MSKPVPHLRLVPQLPPVTDRHGIAANICAAAGAVCVIIGTKTGDGAEVWWTPEEAESFGDDLKRFAKAARELASNKAE